MSDRSPEMSLIFSEMFLIFLEMCFIFSEMCFIFSEMCLIFFGMSDVLLVIFRRGFGCFLRFRRFSLFGIEMQGVCAERIDFEAVGNVV